jgi:hypothetical protein
MGEVGSWVLSCATRSCKNKSLELFASESDVELLELLELLEVRCVACWAAKADAAMGLIVIVFSPSHSLTALYRY